MVFTALQNVKTISQLCKQFYLFTNNNLHRRSQLINQEVPKSFNWILLPAKNLVLFCCTIPKMYTNALFISALTMLRIFVADHAKHCCFLFIQCESCFYYYYYHLFSKGKQLNLLVSNWKYFFFLLCCTEMDFTIGIYLMMGDLQ